MSRDALDSLQGDMAAHQRRFSPEVTAEANRVLAATELERIDQQLADEKPAPEPEAEIVPPADPSTERREFNGQNYLIDKGPDKPLSGRATEAEYWFLQHAMPRIRMLLTKVESGPLGSPSWSQRVMAVMESQTRANSWRRSGRPDLAADLERKFMHELLILLEQSSVTFGDWKADPERKIYG